VADDDDDDDDEDEEKDDNGGGGGDFGVDLVSGAVQILRRR
jgi:hypothetical protein